MPAILKKPASRVLKSNAWDECVDAVLLRKSLLKLLENNLHGVDIQLTACLVTCFSLYLAFLDQMDPKEIRELREELERAANAKILPRILWERGQEKPRVRDRHFPTVGEFDFFEMETVAQFHLVIGNPHRASRLGCIQRRIHTQS